MINFMEGLARRVGDMLLAHFEEDEKLLDLRSTPKEAATKYDQIADDMIIREISGRYPGHSILTEESGLVKGITEWLWVVDSLDGTGNYAGWNPLFSVCIAVMHSGELLMGVVYAPAIGEFYLAEKSSGAYLNQRRIRVSETSVLKQSYLLYCEGGEKDRMNTGGTISRVYPEVTDLRKLGSAGLETAWVAAGKAEAYYTTKLDPWDVAPGVLLVREAGGKVTDFSGEGWKLEKGDWLFSNGKVHPALLKLINRK